VKRLNVECDGEEWHNSTVVQYQDQDRDSLGPPSTSDRRSHSTRTALVVSVAPPGISGAQRPTEGCTQRITHARIITVPDYNLLQSGDHGPSTIPLLMLKRPSTTR